MSNTLHLTNLPTTTDCDALQRHCQSIGLEVEVHVPIDRHTGRARGFAFLTFGSEEEATRGIEQLHGCSFDGVKLDVHFAVDMERPPMRFADGSSPVGRRHSRPPTENEL